MVSREMLDLAASAAPKGRGSLLLVIPAFNEQGAIGDVVRAARRCLPEADVLVMDDGSADETAREAQRAGAHVISHPFNLGIGGTVQTGLRFAQRHGYEHVLRMDGDGQHDPQSLRSLLAPVQAGLADITVGSRFLDRKADMRIPLFRLIGIRLFASEVRLLTGRRATDTTSGMAAMNRRAVSLLASYMPQDYPEVESRIIAHAAGLTTIEVPVHMMERVAGVSSIGSWRSLYYALKVSIAVLLTAIKHSPKLAPEGPDAGRTFARHGAQPGVADSHHSADPGAQAA